MEKLTLADLTLAYRVHGHGPDVVLIHGWLSSWRVWEGTVHTLVIAGYRCWSLDLPGFGESSQPGLEWYTLDNLGQAVAQFLGILQLRDVCLLGHSMGGMITLHLAAERPDLVSRLIAVSPVVTGRINPLAERLLVGRMGEWLLGRSHDLWNLAAAGTRRLAVEPWARSRPEVQRNLEDAARASCAATIAGLRCVLQSDLSPRLAHIRARSLIIAGTLDQTVPPRESRLAAARIPNARLVLLPGVRHAPMDERPATFHRLVLDFLRQP